MSLENELLRKCIEEKVERCKGWLGEVIGKLDRLERMLLFLIDQAADRYVDAAEKRTALLKIRALLRDATTNALVHEEMRDEGKARGMKLAFDQFHERLEEYGLSGIARALREE